MARPHPTTGNGVPVGDEPTVVRGAPAEVLVVGQEDWSVSAAVRELEASGHTVHRCCDNTDNPFPCNALVPGRGCPLDTGAVRVVLAVRGRPGGQLTIGEFGAVCGARAGLPIVLAGFHAASPLAAYAEPVPMSGTVAERVEAATA